MNAQELFNKDGKAIGVFFCEKCKMIARSKSYVEECCLPKICTDCKTAACGNSRTICNDCKAKREREKHAALVAKAELVTDLDGWVYCEQYEGFHDGYFESIEDLYDGLVCDEVEADAWPEYVFSCKATPPSKLFAANIIDSQWGDDMFEDWQDQVVGMDELQAALDVFGEKNKELVTYYPDYKKVVKLKTHAEIMKDE